MALRVAKAELPAGLRDDMIKQLGGAALVPVCGAERVAMVLARASRFAFASTTVWLNGAPAGRIEIAGQLAAVSLVVENGRVARIYAVANPRKLTRLDEPTELAR